MFNLGMVIFTCCFLKKVLSEFDVVRQLLTSSMATDSTITSFQRKGNSPYIKKSRVYSLPLFHISCQEILTLHRKKLEEVQVKGTRNTRNRPHLSNTK